MKYTDDETRVMQMAADKGYKLVKSRSRDPREAGHGTWQVCDEETGRPIPGAGFPGSLEAAEDYVNRDSHYSSSLSAVTPRAGHNVFTAGGGTPEYRIEDGASEARRVS